MIPYYILALFPPVVSYFIFSSKEQQKKRNRLMLTLFFGIFIFLVAFRARSIGADTVNYTNIFKQVSLLNWDKVEGLESLEGGYLYFNKILTLFSNDYRLLLVVVALLSIIPMAIMLVKESENGILTIVLFMAVAPFSMYFSGLRQVLAMALIVPAYYLTKHKKLLPFILVVLFAMLFHTSAFIMVLIYPLYHIRITTNKFLVMIPVILLVYLFNGPIFSFLVEMLGEGYENYNVIEDTGAITMVILFVIFAAFAFTIADDKKLSKDDFGLRNLLVIALVLQLFAPINHIAMRMNYYFIPFIPILMPKLINKSKAEYRQIAIFASVVMSIFFLLYFFFNAHTTVDGGVMKIFPYKSMWE